MTASVDAVAYATIIFDCDGVIMNSNSIKTEVFHDVALRFGKDAADLLVSFHLQHGGISRYHKFKYLIEDILRRSASEEEIAQLASDFGRRVYQRLLRCEVSPSLAKMRKRMPQTSLAVVSGGDQEELRRIFAQRNLTTIFDGGIYGSPRTKDEILLHQFQSGKLAMPAVFLGDSQYDHEAATRAGLDFIFISGWSDFTNWQTYCQMNKVKTVESLEKALQVVLATQSVNSKLE